mmetsp:Transcript_1090/g.2293  ORF Transcript_1090/g.2293 Transcript_1090/m.2293 type:complete len:109 (+) Transcript_1090:152-478(+)
MEGIGPEGDADSSSFCSSAHLLTRVATMHAALSDCNSLGGSEPSSSLSSSSLPIRSESSSSSSCASSSPLLIPSAPAHRPTEAELTSLYSELVAAQSRVIPSSSVVRS